MNSKLIKASLPWYRHPWPWILMSGPFVVVVAGIYTAYLATVSNDGLVDDDYYKQGLAINQASARDQMAAQRGLQAEVMQNAEALQIRILLRGNPDVALPPVLRLRITHPTRAGVDQQLELRADAGGSYSGKLATPLVGRWHVSIEDEKSEWRLSGDWIVEKTASLRLPARAQ